MLLRRFFNEVRTQLNSGFLSSPFSFCAHIRFWDIPSPPLRRVRESSLLTAAPLTSTQNLLSHSFSHSKTSM